MIPPLVGDYRSTPMERHDTRLNMMGSGLRMCGSITMGWSRVSRIIVSHFVWWWIWIGGDWDDIAYRRYVWRSSKGDYVPLQLRGTTSPFNPGRTRSRPPFLWKKGWSFFWEWGYTKESHQLMFSRFRKGFIPLRNRWGEVLLAVRLHQFHIDLRQLTLFDVDSHQFTSVDVIWRQFTSIDEHWSSAVLQNHIATERVAILSGTERISRTTG
jgi:hypothetical protein